MHLHRSRVVFALLGVWSLLAQPAGAGDEDTFSAQVPPNVLLFIDNSGSMNTIMEHPSFDPAETLATPCNVLPSGGGSAWIADDNGEFILRLCGATECYFDILSIDPGYTLTPDPTDHPLTGFLERTFCGQTRRLYHDGRNEAFGNSTWHHDVYVNWLYSLDETDNTTLIGPPGEERTAVTILAEIDDPASGQNFITGETFSTFQRSRIAAARDIARDVIYQTNSDCPAFLGDCGIYEDRVRFGLGQFHRSSHGAFVSVPIDEYSNNRTALESRIASLNALTATPLGESLFKIYTYFMSRDSSDRPVGVDGTTVFPPYSYNATNGDFTSTSSSIPDDPVVAECQKNFAIMVTDGAPTADNFATSGSNTLGFADFRSRLIGDYAPDSPGDPDIGTDATPEEGSPPWTTGSGAGYLDDIALFMQDTDSRPEFPDTTNVVDVYTVGFSTVGPVNSLLQKTAANGNGLSFLGNQADTLTEALVSSIQDIISKSQGFSAATVPAARTSQGGALYTTLFQPTSTRPFWPGLLRAYTITQQGEILDRNGSCALTDLADPALCASGTFLEEDVAPPWWNARDEMPGANGRNLTVSLSSSEVAFDHGLSGSDLGLGSALLTDFPSSPSVPSTSELDEAVVAFLAGCEWGTGLTSSGSDEFDGCVDRTRVVAGVSVPDRLGDIFHSNPVVVGPPSSFLPEPSYQLFASDPDHVHRRRVIMAGANDGFFHGFNAGDWQPTPAPAGYDQGTGEEVFGFMPWGAREKVQDLAKSDATAHPITVDGSPSVADVWIDRNGNPDDPKVASEWQTIVVSGLREGGNHYFALDVTDPTSSGYPQYMWEFPEEGDTTWLPYFGQTWSQPVITRIRLENASGDILERWVAIVGFGYDPTSDPNDTTPLGYDPASLKGRGIGMIDVETGELVAARKFGTATGDVPGMQYAIASTPGVLDYDQDGFADLIYVGDVGGNVWKWVVRSPGTANPSDSELFQASWSFRKFFSEDPSRVSGHRRSFFFAPAATLINGILHLGLGTGERTNLLCSSSRDGCTLMNRFYVLKDRDVWDNGSPGTIDGRAIPTGDLTDVTAFENTCPAVEPRGFFFEVADGEKFSTNTEVFNAFFFASTFRPAVTDVCDPSGFSTLYGVLAKCGQGFFGPPSPLSPIAGIDRTLDLGTGMPTDARLSIAPGEGGNRLIISKQHGEIVNIDSGSSSAENGMLYWRELD